MNRFLLLVKNLFATFIVGIGLGLFFYVFRYQIFSIIDLDTENALLYSKFIIASVIFSVFMVTTYWFTSLTSNLIRFTLISSIITFIVYYTQNITTLDQIISTFIIGNLLLLLVELVLIVIYFGGRIFRIFRIFKKDY